MIFEGMELLDSFSVEIMDDPYSFLMNLMYGEDSVEVDDIVHQAVHQTGTVQLPQVCLRLYSTKSDGTKFVAEKSGLNQWNAGGRVRNANELYIPFPAEDRARTVGFFPSRHTVFKLTLPDGSVIPAKICQADGKAIMSNPNSILGAWLLRNVFEIPEGTLVTYEMLQRFGIDSVIFTKFGEFEYSVDFSEIGTYEAFYEQVEEAQV